MNSITEPFRSDSVDDFLRLVLVEVVVVVPPLLLLWWSVLVVLLSSCWPFAMIELLMLLLLLLLAAGGPIFARNLFDVAADAKHQLMSSGYNDDDASKKINHPH